MSDIDIDKLEHTQDCCAFCGSERVADHLFAHCGALFNTNTQRWQGCLKIRTRLNEAVDEILHSYDSFNGHSLSEWAEVTAVRIADMVTGVDPEERQLLEEVLTKALAASPSECEKLIGTGYIEEEYFEDLDESEE